MAESGAVERVTLLMRQGLRGREAKSPPTLFMIDRAVVGAVGSVRAFKDARYTVAGALEIDPATRAIVGGRVDSGLMDLPWRSAPYGCVFSLDRDRVRMYSTLAWFFVGRCGGSDVDPELAARAKQYYDEEVRSGRAQVTERERQDDDYVTARWLMQARELTF
jgi:hypothetical protein